MPPSLGYDTFWLLVGAVYVALLALYFKVVRRYLK